MRLSYFIYDLGTGDILARLSCEAGRDRKATLLHYPGRGATIAGADASPLSAFRIDLETGELVAKAPA